MSQRSGHITNWLEQVKADAEQLTRERLAKQGISAKTEPQKRAESAQEAETVEAPAPKSKK